MVTNVELTRRVYEALNRWDLDAVREAFDPAIEWREAEGNPAQPDGSPWFGPDAVRERLFDRIAAGWDEFRASPVAFHDAGDSVVVEGRYRGVIRTSARRVDAQFCHIWRVRDGRFACFQQYVDTAQLQTAIFGSRGT